MRNPLSLSLSRMYVWPPMLDDVIVPFKPSRRRWITAEGNGKARGGGRSALKAGTKLYTSFPADAPIGSLRNEGAEDARCSRSSIARKGEEDTFPSRIPILYNAVVPSVPV